MPEAEERNLGLSRGKWTLARYLTERSSAPTSPIVAPDDDLLHVTKMAVNAPVPSATYVVDEQGHYLGVVSDTRLARSIFEFLDPGLLLENHPMAKTGLLKREAAAATKTARSVMKADHRPMSDQATVWEAMEMLYRSRRDELPVVDGAGQLVGVIRALDILREWVEDALLIRQRDETDSYY